MLPSRRSLKYFEALNREGDNFDYWAWLTRVREEEAMERGEPTSAQAPKHQPVFKSAAVSDRPHLILPPLFVPPRRRGTAQSKRPDKSARSAAPYSMRERLLKVCDVWDETLDDRSRDSVYPYLRAVYSLVVKYQAERKTKELMHCAAELADVPYDENAEPFSTIIRCTCDRKLDSKTTSELSRALRYAAYRDRPPRLLTQFIKK